MATDQGNALSILFVLCLCWFSKDLRAKIVECWIFLAKDHWQLYSRFNILDTFRQLVWSNSIGLVYVLQYLESISHTRSLTTACRLDNHCRFHFCHLGVCHICFCPVLLTAGLGFAAVRCSGIYFRRSSPVGTLGGVSSNVFYNTFSPISRSPFFLSLSSRAWYIERYCRPVEPRFIES